MIALILQIALLLGAAWMGLLDSISNSIGPAHPERDSKKYLEEKGASAALILKLTELEPLTAADFDYLAEQKDIDVRHLVAKNPHLTLEQRQRFQRDPSTFVRQGAAANKSLTRAEIENILATQPTPRTYLSEFLSLAGNPAVPEDLLLKLFHLPGGRDYLVGFALNPKCPEEIRAAIRASDNGLAQTLLSDQEERELRAKSSQTEKESP